MREHIPALMEKHQTPGLTVAVADKGQLVWEAGFGLADVTRSEPMTPETVVRSGSLAKAYTATATMILIDRGCLTLNDPINRFLPFQVRNPLGGREITIRDLMTHTSGLGADAASDWVPASPLAEDLRSEYQREWSALYGGQAIRRWTHPVGTAWTYSNLGIATLGLIVERANSEGTSFSEFVERNVMGALGMTYSCFPPAQTSSCVPPEVWSRTRSGYSRMGGADVPSLNVHLREYPAGGVLGRPSDHIKLLQAMMNGGELNGRRLLNEQTAAQMLTPAVDLASLTNAHEIPVEAQGLVWRLKDRGQPWASFEHGGAHMFCWRTQSRAWPRYKAALTVAVNQWVLPDDTREVDEAADFVGTWLRYRQPKCPGQLDAEKLSYARGALLAAAYRVAFAVSGEVPEAALEQATAGTRDRAGDWEPTAFRRGFQAVTALPATLKAIQQFWLSPASEVDSAMIRAAYTQLGGANEAGYLWRLLPPDGSQATH